MNLTHKHRMMPIAQNAYNEKVLPEFNILSMFEHVLQHKWSRSFSVATCYLHEFVLFLALL